MKKNALLNAEEPQAHEVFGRIAHEVLCGYAKSLSDEEGKMFMRECNENELLLNLYGGAAMSTLKLLVLAMIGKEDMDPRLAVEKVLAGVVKESGRAVGIRHFTFDFWAEPLHGIGSKLFGMDFGSGPNDTIEEYLRRAREMRNVYDEGFNASYAPIKIRAEA